MVKPFFAGSIVVCPRAVLRFCRTKPTYDKIVVSNYLAFSNGAL
jgi:hypothetical protein